MLDQMYAKFEVRGQIIKARTHTQKKEDGKTFGFLTVATGTAAIEFFADPKRINSGELAEGREVMIAGTLNVTQVKRNGRDEQEIKLYADAILVDDGKPVAASAK